MPIPSGSQVVSENYFFSARQRVCCAGKLKRLIHICLFCLALTLSLRAADSPYNVDSWTTEDGDGLPQNSIIAITQTHDGYLWLGTQNGLVRFDGNSFTSFNVNNTPGLPGDVIVFLFEDSRSNLWIGTGNAGLCAIQNGVLTNFNVSIPGRKITSAFEDKAGTVWFGTPDGNCLCWQNGRLDLRPANVSAPLALQFFERSWHLLVSGQNGVDWQLQDGRVEKISDGRMIKDYGPVPWAYSPVSVQFKIPDGTVGLIAVDGNVTAASEDAGGNLIVGTKNSGVFWLDATSGWRQITTTNGLPRSPVLAFYFDRENNLWAGTDGGGLNRIKESIFNTPANLSGVAQSAAEDAEDGLWTAFNGGGLAYVLTNSVQHFGIGMYSNAWSVLVDNRQQVWAGTRGEGLFRFTASYYFRPVIEALPIGLQIYALFQSHDGNLWAGGQNGLGCYDGTNWNFFTSADGLPANAIRAIAESTNGSLWVGTEGGGLFSQRNGKFLPANAPVKDISCLLVDHDDVLWVGTSGHGLARFAQGQWTTYAAKDGLAADDIGYLIEDDFGNLWIGSYEGLMRVDKKSLADFAADKSKAISCRIFLTRECSAGAQPAAIRAHDGKLWFPTIAGLVSVNPADLKTDTNPPPVVIESVLVDGVPQKDNPLSSIWPSAITLTPTNEELDIHFTALNFSAPKRAQLAVRFKYQLIGRDKGFTDIGDERMMQFTKLPPGDYIFHVKACNEDGIWNDAGAKLEIIVEPPFWRTKSFLLVSALVLLGVLAGIIYLISTAKLKREVRALHQKELIERERARIARDLHDQLGANLTQVTLLGEMAEMDKELPDEVEQHAQQICATARETTRSLDEIVWAVNPSNDTLEGLANYACKYAQDYFALANVSFRSELPPELPPSPILPEVRHNVFLAFKEAVNNVVKHARATEARVRLQLEADKFILSVEDNGRGLGDVSEKKLRNGLKNMRKRLTDIHGEFEITPRPEGGTVVRLIVPRKD